MAIADANGEADTITFSGVTVINLTTGHLSLTGEAFDLTIDGPGVTINGAATAAATNRIFNFNVAGGDPTITLSGLTLANGNLTAGNNGGAIQIHNDPLVLTNVKFNTNKTAGTGGAIASTTAIAANLTVDSCTFTGNTATGVGGAIVGTTTISLSVANSTFTSNTSGSTGGAIQMTVGGTASIGTSTFTTNKSTGNGAALSTAGVTTMTVNGSVFTGNAGSNGGVIRFNSAAPSVLTFDTCSMTGNTSTGRGGAVYSVATGTVSITSSTIANNIATGNGGGIALTVAPTTITNCTISGNESKGTSGGGGFYSTTAVVTFNNTTIASNKASNAAGLGGGIRKTSATGTLTLSSTIVGQNTASGVGGDDIHATAAITIAGDNNLVQDTVGNFTLSPSSITGADPLLGPLASNGGFTQTRALLAGSPAFNSGNNLAGLSFDQRGLGFPREVQGKAEIGAWEGISLVPSAKATAPDVPPILGTVTVVVDYADETAIDTASIDVNDLTLSGPGYPVPVAPSSAMFSGAGVMVTATYVFPAPAGGWNYTHNGTYDVNMKASQVFDTDGPNAVSAGKIGGFTVAVPALYTVDVISDIDDGKTGVGQLSIREAIKLANNDKGPSTIGFDSVAFSGSKTISMTAAAELTITQSVEIVGTGSANLTINANSASRVLNINVSAIDTVVKISGMTLTGGSTTTDGGGITMNTADLTLTDVVVTGNKTTLEGGGINISSAAGKLTLVDSVVSNNSTGPGTQDGGGINFDVSATNDTAQVLTLLRSTISGNVANDDGGGIYFFLDGTLVMTDSTVSGNSANGDDGGGAYLFSVKSTITNSTWANNTAKDSGGALALLSTDTIDILNSTLAKNVGTNGGNVFITAGWTVNLNSTIVAQGVAPTGPNISGTVSTALYTLVNDDTGAVIPFDPTNIIGMDPLLSQLASFGGPTQTMGLKTGSPAVNAGNNPQSLVFDQRGSSFPRVVGGTPDIGAFEGVLPIPFASASAPDVPPILGTVTVTVQYTDETAINSGGIDLNDIRLSGPGYPAPIAPTSVMVTGAGTLVTATYEFPTPAGGWIGLYSGTYTVTMQSNQVFDTDGPNAVLPGSIGSFKVGIAANYVVNQVGDTDDLDLFNGKMTLREAVRLSNNNKGILDQITFDSALNGKTIFLATELAPTDSVVIVGPGADKLAISGNNAVRIFNLGTLAGLAIELNGLTFANGNVAGNGGVVDMGGDSTLTINDCVITGGASTAAAGGIRSGATIGGSLIVRRSTFMNNTATNGGSAIFCRTDMLVEDSTFINNTASSATFGGAAIGLSGSGGARSWIIRNSTFTSNTTAGIGGAIRWESSVGTVTIQNSTIVGNTASAANGAGGIAVSAGTGEILLESTIVANNITPISANTELFSANLITANFSAITSSNGATVFAPDATTTALLGQNFMLSALGSYGGPTQTVRLLPGSPLIDMGSNPATLMFDQRGTGFPRVINGTADIGSTEGALVNPLAKATAPNVPPALSTFTVTVDYTDETAVDTASIDVNDITVSGPAFITPATPISVMFTGGGTSVSATYVFNAPPSGWTGIHNGVYTISMVSNQVFDTDGPNSAFAGKIGSFNVGVPLPPLLVDNIGDADDGIYTAGQLTLREAINLANKSIGSADLISFSPLLSGMTIVLSTELAINDPVIINGLGSNKLTISGNGTVRVFNTSAAVASAVISINDLTLANGSAATGGIMQIADESVTLNRVVVVGGIASGSGGGISVSAAAGVLTVNECLFHNNVSPAGGGIIINAGAGLLVVRSTFTNNETTIGNTGGAIRILGTAGAFGWTIRNSTFFGNKAGFNGGAIGLGNATSGTLLIQNSTITGNIADSDNNASGSGGGIGQNNITNTAVVVLESCIVSGNTTLSGTGYNDLFSPANITANFSLIGTSAGAPSFTPDAKTTALLGQAPMLAALTDNGGPTQTMRLLPGSPAINNGSNSSGALFDQRGFGFDRASPAGMPDIGAYEVQPPSITGVVINGGAVQRSRVTSVTVTFNEHVTLPVTPETAFELKRQGDGALPTLVATLDNTGLSTVVTLTFTGTTAVDFGSLADGRYTLTINSSLVSGVDGQLDGNNDGTGGDNYVLASDPFPNPATNIFRLFGDGNGDGVVTSLDFAMFRTVFGVAGPVFDYDNNGVVNSNDFAEFRKRFGLQVP